MAQDTTPALVIYPGQLVNNTYQTNFEFAFDKGFYGEVKVAFVRRGLTEYEHNPSSDLYDIHGYLYAWNGGVYTKTETATTDTPLYDKDGVATGDMWEEDMYREPKNDIISNGYVEWRGSPITENDIICIVRETRKDQPYTYPNNQKHIERALDNLSRQIQELQLTADNALKVDPSWNYTMDDERKMDPIAWLQTIVRSKGLTLRELRVNGNYAEYTTDDPDSETKTWHVLAGVKSGNAGVVSHIRETKVLAEDGVTYIPYLEYSVDGGNTWKPAGRGQSELVHLYVKKAGDTMTGALSVIDENGTIGELITLRNGNNTHRTWIIAPSSAGSVLSLMCDPTSQTGKRGYDFSNASISPATDNFYALGSSVHHWDRAYIDAINNGYDIAVPVTAAADTLALHSEITGITNLIPAQTTAENQLADKNFVNSSVATNTAFFVGTFNSVADLEAYSGTLTNNDYAFVVGTDSAGNTVYNRYKYTTATTPASWAFEYALNNSSFTAEQWATINSGATSTDIGLARTAVQPAGVGNGTITIKQGSVTKGTFTTNQSGDTTIDLEGTGTYYPDLFDFKWKDCTMTHTGWKLSDGNWINKADAQTAYQHLSTEMHPGAMDYKWSVTISGDVYWRDTDKDASGETYEYAYTNFFGNTVQTIYTATQIGTYTTSADFYDGPTSGATLFASVTSSSAFDRDFVYVPERDTVAGIDILYYVAADGHKIALANQDANIASLYTATGVAWYYVVDITNEQFKLPRTQYGFVGSRGNVGNYVPESVPNITGKTNNVLIGSGGSGTTGTFSNTNVRNYAIRNDGTNEYVVDLNFSASNSSSSYQTDAPVQQRATQMYLYFYVGV